MEAANGELSEEDHAEAHEVGTVELVKRPIAPLTPVRRSGALLRGTKPRSGIRGGGEDVRVAIGDRPQEFAEYRQALECPTGIARTERVEIGEGGTPPSPIKCTYWLTPTVNQERQAGFRSPPP